MFILIRDTTFPGNHHLSLSLPPSSFLHWNHTAPHPRPDTQYTLRDITAEQMTLYQLDIILKEVIFPGTILFHPQAEFHPLGQWVPGPCGPRVSVSVWLTKGNVSVWHDSGLPVASDSGITESV